MADDQHRRTSSVRPQASETKRAAPTASARRTGGPDPLVELARLIGQNELPAQDAGRAVRRREGQDVPDRTVPRPQPPQSPGGQQRPAGQPGPSSAQPPPSPAAQKRPPAQPAPSPALRPPPSQPTPPPGFQQRRPGQSPQPPERTDGYDPQYERHPDQRYDGYAEPKPAASPQTRSQPGAARAWQGPPPDLSDPYRAEAGWRPPSRPKEPSAPTDPAAYHRPGQAGGAGALPPAQASRPAPRVTTEGRRAQAPTPGDIAQSQPSPEQVYQPDKYYEDRQAGAAGRGQSARYDEQYAHDDSAGDYQVGDAPRNRRLWLVASIVALAVVGTAGAYGYRTMLGGGADVQQTTLPVIRADNSPKKIASATASNSDKQGQERTGATGERVVPREEQPLTIQDPNARALVPQPPSAINVPATTPTDTIDTRSPSPSAGVAGEPKKIKTVTIRPDGDPSDAAPAAAPRAAPSATAAPARAPAARAPAGSSEPQATTPQAARPPAPRTQTAVATAPARSESGYFVQLSAQKSQEDAQASFRAMQAKYPSVLSGRQPFIRRKEQAGKGVYFGAQVGPFASREQANQLCEDLKAAGGSCFIERN